MFKKVNFMETRTETHRLSLPECIALPLLVKAEEAFCSLERRSLSQCGRQRAPMGGGGGLDGSGLSARWRALVWVSDWIRLRLMVCWRGGSLRGECSRLQGRGATLNRQDWQWEAMGTEKGSGGGWRRLQSVLESYMCIWTLYWRDFLLFVLCSWHILSVVSPSVPFCCWRMYPCNCWPDCFISSTGFFIFK